MSKASKPPASGWTWVDNAVVGRIADIGTTALAVYVILAKFAGPDRRCFPAVSTIATLLGKGNRTVQAAIRCLSKAGLIRVEARGGRGGTTSNLYTLPPVDQVKQTAGGEADCGGPVQLVAGEQELPNKIHSTRPREQRVPLPKELDHADFREAWDGFLEHRREIRKAATHRAQRALLKKCAAWGKLNAIAAIENSIAGGWQNLFDPDGNRNGNGNPTNQRGRYRNGDEKHQDRHYESSTPASDGA